MNSPLQPSEEMREKAREIIWKSTIEIGCVLPTDVGVSFNKNLAIALLQMRERTIEECAKVAESKKPYSSYEPCSIGRSERYIYCKCPKKIVAAIRNLGKKEN